MRNGTPQFYSEFHDVVEEAAILHSAGFSEPAIALLEAYIASVPARGASLVLLDLYFATGKQAEFERTVMTYLGAFPQEPAPRWGTPAAVASVGTLQLEGVLDASTDCLARLREYAGSRRAFALDMSQVSRIAFPFLGEFAAALRAFNQQGRRVILANISELHTVLLQAVGVQAVFMRRRATSPVAANVEREPLAAAA